MLSVFFIGLCLLGFKYIHLECQFEVFEFYVIWYSIKKPLLKEGPLYIEESFSLATWLSSYVWTNIDCWKSMRSTGRFLTHKMCVMK